MKPVLRVALKFSEMNPVQIVDTIIDYYDIFLSDNNLADNPMVMSAYYSSAANEVRNLKINWRAREQIIFKLETIARDASLRIRYDILKKAFDQTI